ncbi:MAG: hypothetical protein ABH827_01435 [bacterium]
MRNSGVFRLFGCFQIGVFGLMCGCFGSLWAVDQNFVEQNYNNSLAGIKEYVGQACVGSEAVSVKTEDLMALSRQLQQKRGPVLPKIKKYSVVDLNRRFLPHNTDSPKVAQYPDITKIVQETRAIDFGTRAPQALGVQFTGGTFNDSGYFPPDSMGVVGPTQFIVFINGLLRSFNKITGQPDGVLNINPDDFFLPVNPSGQACDTRIRYDRLSKRWYLTAINFDEKPSNRILLAVSNSSTITAQTVWRFFYIQARSGVFADYPTLGIDANALYIGGKTFQSEPTGVDWQEQYEDAYVVKKSSLLGTGPIVYTRFSILVNFENIVGPYVLQGVDNLNKSATTGYFIAVDYFYFGLLVFYKIATPGGVPKLSGPFKLTVPDTAFPINVNHLGNQDTRNGLLDCIDDRLMCAHIRGSSLWTVHNIGVNNLGSGSENVTITRNGCRWYQIDISQTLPRLLQSGTLYSRTADNQLTALNYWMPSIMTSGQGHMAIGCSVAGSTHRVDAVTAGRLRTNSLGSLQAPRYITQTASAYNPPGDTGGGITARRWGDYSYTCVDPTDDMTMWTIQEYCASTNTWGVRVAQLKAPLPATPIKAMPAKIARGKTSVTVSIQGKSVSGSGFFDPGLGFSKRIRATVSGGVTVKSVKYASPTSVTLTLSTKFAKAGKKTITIINPDGQKKATANLIQVI